MIYARATTGVELKEAGEYIFRVVPSDSGQAAAMADIALFEGYTSAATIVLDSPYGVGIERAPRRVHQKFAVQQ
jgi:ABC-type branched-subunit amino acid transport system substrate-binding protein